MGETYVYVANAESNDISIYRLNRPDGSLESRGAAPAIGPAMPMAISPDRRFLHVSIRSKPYSVQTFAIDSLDGGLRPVSTTVVPATLAYIGLDATGQFLLGASYREHSACVLRVDAKGVPQPKPVAMLQPGIHPHSAVLSPDNRYLFIPVLGDDIIAQYTFDQATGITTPNPVPKIAVAKGDGPRHARFSPDGRFFFVLTELSGKVYTFAYDATHGLLEEVGCISLTPPGGEDPAPMWGAEIRVSPDGKYVFASERTGSHLVCYAVNRDSGELNHAGHVPTETQPRGFSLDSSGGYMVVAGEKSNQVSCYTVDNATGDLTLTCRAAAGGSPNWVEFVDV